jgi:hypothetical protein
MLNQNIISNKFDLKLVITFSSYWCTAIFTKSRSLHNILKKQRKSTKIVKKTTLKRGTTPSKSTTLKREKRRQKLTTLIHTKETQNHSQKDDTQGTYDASRPKKHRQKKNVNKRFPKMAPRAMTKLTITDRTSKDLKNYRSFYKRI